MPRTKGKSWFKLKRVALGIILVVILCGLLLAVIRPAGLVWRIQLVQQKMRTEHLGTSWAELGVSLIPSSWGVRRFIDPGVNHWVKKLDFPLEQENPWKIFKLFVGKTACMDSFDTHVSVLKAGKLPHDFHQHPEEEIIIPLSGDVEILRAKDGSGAGQTTERIGKGRFVYHAHNDFHTIRAVGPEPSSYLIFKWSSAASRPGNDTTLPSSTFSFDASGSALEPGFKRKVLFASPTVYLDKLHSHYSTMQQGAGYDAHDDPYDVAIFVLEGTVETIGEQVSGPGAIFYSAHKPHGMRNRGNVPAKYLVFEFHGCQTGSHDSQEHPVR